jgi:hypothetical protein
MLRTRGSRAERLAAVTLLLWISTASRTSVATAGRSGVTERRAGLVMHRGSGISARLGGDEFVLLVEEFEGRPC